MKSRNHPRPRTTVRANGRRIPGRQAANLDIRDLAEAESLIGELEIVREALAHPEAVNVSEGDAAYMLQRINDVEPLIRGAIQDWDEVVSISL